MPARRGAGVDRLFDLTGRVVVVTGASSGLGAQFAGTLAARGARVVLAARRQGPIQRLAATLPDALAVRCDVTNCDDRATLAAAAYEAYGSVDVLVNNAGVNQPMALSKESDDDFRRILETNLVATYALSRSFGLRMADAGGGSIINIASVIGLVGLGGRIPVAGYAASKGGVINLTRELAAHWGRTGVRVNAIAPGVIRTDLTVEALSSDQGAASLVRRIPMGRPGNPSELDGALVYLASPASSYVTGSVVTVDGGWTAT